MAIRWIQRLRHGGWERTVVMTGLSQFFSIMGFSFALPFAPFYLQDLGVTDPVRLKFWVALFGAATPLSLAVFSPLWGHLADRYGRRLMLLRANVAGAVIIALMGGVRSAPALVFLRLMQGMFTGTMTAAQTMVSVHAPSHRSGQALGALTAAVFSGTLTGMLVGGMVADGIGFRAAFLVGAFFLLIAASLVAWGTAEKPREIPIAPPRASSGRNTSFGQGVFPVLLLIALLSFARQFDISFLPLRVQEIHGRLAGASTWTGALNAVGGVAGLLAALVLGRWTDRTPPSRLALYLTLGAGMLMAAQVPVNCFAVLFPVRFAMVFFTGGIDPVMQTWLTRVTRESWRGAAFGWAGTARAVGWFLAPLGSGWVAAHYGVRAVFLVGGLVFLALLPGVHRAGRRGGPRDPGRQGAQIHQTNADAAATAATVNGPPTAMNSPKPTA